MRNNSINIVCLLVLLLGFAGTSIAAPRAVVTDFSIAPHMVYSRDENRERNDWPEAHQTVRQKSGWWMTSENVYYNENIGISAREILSKDLSCLFDMVSQYELEASLAKKREAISDQLNVDGPALTRAVAKISPVRLGRELNADYVVTGHFDSVSSRANRFWGYVKSPLSVTVMAYDTRTGKNLFTKNYHITGWGHSQYGSFKKLSPTIVHDISLALQCRAEQRSKAYTR